MEERIELDRATKVMSRVYPLVSDRYKVVLIDAIVIIILASLYSFILDGLGNVPNWVRVICLASCFLYEPLSISFFRGTIGHWMGNLKVVKSSDEISKIPIWLSIVRTTIKYILGIYSLFTINTKNQGRAIHDMVVGSMVLFTDEEKRLAE